MFFVYQVVTPSGQLINQHAEAKSIDMLREELVHRGFEVISIDIDLRATLGAMFRSNEIKQRVMVELFSHLKGMLELGLNVTTAIATVRESVEDKVTTDVLARVQDLTDKGFSLSEAFRTTGAFPQLVIVSIEAAERSNRLEHVFGDLADHYRRLGELAATAKKAATYPLIALSVVSGVLLMMLLMVVPQLRSILPPELPWPTRLLLFMSDAAMVAWWVPFVLIAGVIAGVKRITPAQKAKIWESFYKLPYLGKIGLSLELSAVFTNLAMLNGGGIPLLDTLRLAAGGASSEFVRQKLTMCYDRAKQGGKLTEAFRDPLFPPVVHGALAHGEATGRFDKQFSGVATFLRDRTMTQIAFLSTFIEPFVILIGGGMLLFMAMAIFMPIYGQIQGKR